MQFNVVPRTGGLAIDRENGGKRGVRRHNSHMVQIDGTIFSLPQIQALTV